ncbi:23S rRNA (adenine(2030)-N(6))-methyltransferase RlmJ [Breznakiella homolactica]|uniref:Ribosomal RNA large subunit methyltransferase J n=1 Tax=Breznakiella homolactica TaxID=2798577 RepID=A0A7T8BDC8_9SPIR|nr:23S rRNA (adenine(2030)-N(6))-methyltransferase RlmJ [Breznakiella homolactica]QQO11118.1 23S rRNA (adenine(2030)-N(6))-methyltransferase RlmJ [Breznakiella homolactica]
MLSYRHAFHAGNAGDVLKHSVLGFCLSYLGKKDKPYTYIDTHAGAGGYSLNRGFAAKNREWEAGIARITADETVRACPLFGPYFSVLGRDFPDNDWYPGSPLIAQTLLRGQDEAFCFELHRADFTLLQENLGKDRRFHPRNEDGLGALKGLLPPRSGRGCVFIDPSYEMKTDYEQIPQALAMGIRRFPAGVYIIWFPLLNRREAREFPAVLMELYQGNRCCVTLQTSPVPPSERGMYGSGLAVFNPPWVLKEALEESLPALAAALGGSWRLSWTD